MIAPAKPETSVNRYLGMAEPSQRESQRMALQDYFAAVQKQQRNVRARYDAAQTTSEHENHWTNTDSNDADAANSVRVRRTLVKRSRYEHANNGYADGIANTYCNDLVGAGPKLRLQTASESFNRMVEREWNAWCKEVGLRSKLWTMCRAKHVDGEAFAVVRMNGRLRHRVKLDLRLYETEQVHTPYLPWGQDQYIDGIEFDEFDNPIAYDVLRQHPGSDRHVRFDFQPQKVQAKFMLHWFTRVRPGQHRGIPAFTSSLNLGASGRNFRESTVAAADNIANFSLFLKTTLDPNELDATEPMTTFDIQRRMMTALPMGYDAYQPKAEQPVTTYSDFNKTLVAEFARPINMPHNKAMCDSSSSNYASGRLDYQTYYASLDIDRMNADDQVMDQLFNVWFEYAILEFGWLGGNPDTITMPRHAWDWPKHIAVDIKAESQSNHTRLLDGVENLANVYNAEGRDYEDELVARSQRTGIDVDTLRRIDLLKTTPQHAIMYVATELGIEATTTQTQPSQEPESSEDEDDDE